MKKRNIFLLITVAFVAIFIITACSCSNEETKINYLVLVNKYTQLPDDWEVSIELVDAKNAWDEDIKVEKEAYEAYKKLEQALKDEGVIIELDSTYRSVKAQQELWDSWSKDPEKGVDYVRKFVAVPGYSEHHTGLAIDICIRKDGELIYDNDEMIAEREIFAKIHAKLADYGFILRYLENREDSTGYTYEPWHLRYVGSKEIAKEITDKKLTFEEYLASITDLKSNKSATIYRIETALQEHFKELYGDKISASRFNVTKIDYSDNVVSFEVAYQIKPSEDTNVEELTKNGGIYDNDLEWVKDIKGIGKLTTGNNKYSITEFINA